MNLERTKPEQLAAGVMDYMPSQSLAAHEYAERLNAALARLGLTERLTLPPAPNTAIDELPAVVDVPLRKTLSVLMGKAQQGDASALATLEMVAQVMESIFAGLHARDFAGDRPLALPSHESLATLSQGVDALLPRKISNGAWSLLADGTPSDGIDDGVSLVRLFCTDAIDSVTELKDDNEGWVWTNTFSQFPNAKRITFNAAGDKVFGSPLIQHSGVEELNVPYLNRVEEGNSSQGSHFFRCPNLQVFRLDRLTFWQGGYIATAMPLLRELYMPNCQSYLQSITYGGFNAPELEKWILGKLVSFKMANNNGTSFMASCHNLIHIEIGDGTACNLPMEVWNPTSVLSDSERLPIFLSNFKTYIAERLSEQGSGKTLTLSQAVRDAIEGDPTIAQIITSKGWTISPAPSV